MRRCAPNPFLAAPPAAPADSAEAAWSLAEPLLAELQECASRRRVPSATGRWEQRWEVYTGLGGVGLALLRAGLFCRHARADDAAAKALLQGAKEVADACLAADGRSREVSFFCGMPGHLALCAACRHALGDDAGAVPYLKRLLDWQRPALEHEEDELLFGRAGYLYALLWAQKNCGEAAAGFESALQPVAERLVATGRARARRSYKSWPLMWHCFHEPYIGAAHGVVGVLAMLYKCYGLLSARSQELVDETLKKLLSERFDSGNLPIVLGARRDEHVHWCHGAPGMPALFAAALAVREDPALREAALRAGEVVWQRGVILKGQGLCHGLSGNGYGFLSLHRLTGDDEQLRRAWAFARLLQDEGLQRAMRSAPDEQRQVPGVPDSPRSLMEGSAGVLCFLLDLANPATAAFPGWELEP